MRKLVFDFVDDVFVGIVFRKKIPLVDNDQETFRQELADAVEEASFQGESI